MAGYDGGDYEIEWRWKEEIIYWEGRRGFLLDGGWGSEPPTLYVPSAQAWELVVPPWLQGRRAEVVARLEAHSGHRLEDTDDGYGAGGRSDRNLAR
jgi:hypothetical protein